MTGEQKAQTFENHQELKCNPLKTSYKTVSGEAAFNAFQKNHTIIPTWVEQRQSYGRLHIGFEWSYAFLWKIGLQNPDEVIESRAGFLYQGSAVFWKAKVTRYNKTEIYFFINFVFYFMIYNCDNQLETRAAQAVWNIIEIPVKELLPRKSYLVQVINRNEFVL